MHARFYPIINCPQYVFAVNAHDLAVIQVTYSLRWTNVAGCIDGKMKRKFCNGHERIIYICHSEIVSLVNLKANCAWIYEKAIYYMLKTFY